MFNKTCFEVKAFSIMDSTRKKKLMKGTTMGLVILDPKTLEEYWHACNFIAQGDHVSAKKILGSEIRKSRDSNASQVGD